VQSPGKCSNVAVGLLLLLAMGGCGPRRHEPVVRETVAMNTYVTISVYDQPSTGQDIQVLLDSAVAAIRRVEAMASDYIDSSDIGRVNAAAGGNAVAVPHDLAWLVDRAVAFGLDGGGAFNVTIGPVVKRWDFLSEHPHVPSKHLIDSLLTLVDLSAVELRGDSIRLRKRGMALDLGGIAKGYAVDRAAAVLNTGGVHHAIVDIGGNLAVVWDGPRDGDTSAVTVEIRHPRREGEMFGRFTASSCGVSTSGDYQRYFIAGGIRYHHILNPATGYPVRGVAAVTVVAKDAMTADVYSTLAFVLGKEEGMNLLRTTPGVEGLMILEEGDSLRWMATDGLRRTFQRDVRHD
jgi:FAD:protein FMN transferase